MRIPVAILTASMAVGQAWAGEFPVIRDEAVLARHRQQVELILSMSTEQVREDPGFSIDGDRIAVTSFPQRIIDGSAMRYTLSRVTTATVPAQ